MVNVAMLVSDIKTYVHDLTLPNEIVYKAIDNAIRFIENYGTFGYQIKTENASVLAGQTKINTSMDVMRVIEIKNLSSDKYYVKNNAIYLTKPSTENITYNVKYAFKSPTFDGSQASLYVPNYTLLLYGGVFYAALYLNAPEAAIYSKLFQDEVIKYYNDSFFNTDVGNEIEWYPYNDVFNI